MAVTKFSICSRALLRVGANPITSFDDGSAEAIVAGEEYEEALKEALSLYRWRFAATQFTLNRLSGAPTARWAYAFQKPADVLVLYAVTHAGRPVPYDLYGDQIWCDTAENLVADYARRVGEERFPPYFQKALVTELAGTFAMALLKDAETAEVLKGMALADWARARSMDAQQQTSRRVAPSRLVAVRR